MNVWERTRHLANQRLRAYCSEDTRESTGIDQTLVIIDMQEGFSISEHHGGHPNEHNIVTNICSLIGHAIENNWAIICVEFEGYGSTYGEISRAIGNYPHVSTVMKSETDGGKEILECLYNHNKWSRNLVVCGIYGDCCVSDTVAGLYDNSNIVEVDIVSDAIIPDYCSSAELSEYGDCPERLTTTDDLLEEGVTVRDIL